MFGVGEPHASAANTVHLSNWVSSSDTGIFAGGRYSWPALLRAVEGSRQERQWLPAQRAPLPVPALPVALNQGALPCQPAASSGPGRGLCETAPPPKARKKGLRRELEEWQIPARAAEVIQEKRRWWCMCG